MKRIFALMAIFACGLAVYFYPSAIHWWQLRADILRSEQVDNTIESETPPVQNELLTAAHAYNLELGHSDFATYLEDDAAWDANYQRQLRRPVNIPKKTKTSALSQLGSPTDEMMLPFTGPLSPADTLGKVAIPKININLPIYHGTSEAALALGAGHIYGTSLPVGGESTHAVITAHSRQGQSGRFTRIRELEIGDEFYITAAGQTLRYVVDQINVVLPDDVEALQIVPGEDHVTLLTCTPLGLNTHRLLVRGTRADLPHTVMAAPQAHIPFPWFAVWFLGGLALSGLFGYAVQRAYFPKGKKTNEVDGVPLSIEAGA